MLKRIGSLLMATVLILAMLVPPIAMAASDITATYTPKLSATSGTPSTETTMTLSMQLSKASVLNGMYLTVEFDKTCLKYKSGTATMKHAVFQDAHIYYNDNDETTGKLNIVWTSEENTKLPKSFELLSVQFEVVAEAPAGNTDITVKMLDLYTSTVSAGSLIISPVDCAASTKATFTVVELDTAVKDVISAINNIGTVTYSQESKIKINDAQDAYDKLGEAQKALVSNYATLVSAQETYAQLKQAYEDQLAVDALVAKYQETHAEVLALDTDTINNAENKQELLNAVNGALDAYTALPETAVNEGYASTIGTQAQSALFTTKGTLNSYKTLLEKLLKDAEEAAKQEEIKKSAQEYVDNFRNKNAYTLGMTTDKVQSYDEDVIEKSWTEYNSMLLLPDEGVYIKEMMVEDEALMIALRNKIAELKALENQEKAPELIAAEEFKTTYAMVLALDPETLTYDDVFDIQLAKVILEMQDAAVQALLTEEAAILEILYEKSLELEPESSVVEIVNTVEVEKIVKEEVEKVVEKEVEKEVEVEKIVEKEVEIEVEKEVEKIVEIETVTEIEKVVEKLLVQFQNQTGSFNLGVNVRNIGIFVWLLLAMAIASTLIFTVLRISWNVLKKKGGSAHAKV